MKLVVGDISFEYDSSPVLQGVSFHVHPGQVVSIIGPNGSGKSTLLRCLASVLKPKTGTVLLNGEEMTRMAPRRRAQLLGYVPQLDGEVFPLTVWEAVLLGRKPHLSWRVSSADTQVVERVLSFMGLQGLARRYLNELSGGERQRVYLARVLAQEPYAFLFDEPTSSLDLRHQLEVLEQIKRLAEDGQRLVIMVLHDLNLAARFSHHLIFLRHGKIHAAGPPEEVLTPQNLKAVYGIEAMVIPTPYGPSILPMKPVE